MFNLHTKITQCRKRGNNRLFSCVSVQRVRARSPVTNGAGVSYKIQFWHKFLAPISLHLTDVWRRWCKQSKLLVEKITGEIRNCVFSWEFGLNFSFYWVFQLNFFFFRILSRNSQTIMNKKHKLNVFAFVCNCLPYHSDTK